MTDPDLYRPEEPPLQLVTCDACGGRGYTSHRITVYEHGCGFPHDDTDERRCEKCGGQGEWITEADAESPCPECGGSGFDGNGSGYGNVCAHCGGTRYFPLPAGK